VVLARRRFSAYAAPNRIVRTLGILGKAAWWRRELVWQSPDFENASNLVRRKRDRGRPEILKAVFTRANRRSLFAVLRAPVTTVRLCSDEATRLRDRVAPAGRCLFSSDRSQLAQFVLETPRTQAEYVAGKSRQALRTNLHHATEAGITCQRVYGYDEWRRAAEVVLRSRGKAGLTLLETIGPPDPRDRIAFYVATDGEHHPVAFAGTARFGDLVYLFTLMTALDHPAASPSLWALNAFVALDNARDEITHLTVGSALSDPPGTQYLAHLLGYRLRNLRFDRG
jgi:hypothetical protein